MFHATTIIAVRREGQVAIAGDGQVSMGNTIMKQTARKLRLMNEGKVVAGFAGSTADAFTLFEKFEAKVSEFRGNITRAAVELAKDWRTDRVLRRLEALIVADREKTFVISGNGDVIEPDDNIAAIGSGGPALAAARAMVAHSKLSAREIAEGSIKIASDICVFTNGQIVVEELR